MYIPGSEELVIYICAFIGALIGFLWYNAYPAQVFMGDTGSLTIGGIIAVFAIIIHKELLIPILCGVFLVENLSVILQRAYYKAGKRKRSETTAVQTDADSRSFPHFHEFDRTGMYGEVHQARPTVPRIKNYCPFLDCDHRAGSHNDYNAENKVNAEDN